MNTLTRAVRETGRRVMAYETAVVWREAHELARFCFGIEDAVKLGLRVYDRLVDTDAAVEFDIVRLRFVDQQEADKIHDLWMSCYQLWFDVTGKLLQFLPSLEAKFGTVRNADELRRAYRDVELALLPAGIELEANDKLLALRDKALQEHRAGNTVPMT